MIEVNGVSKMFGAFPAISDISFRVEPGEILGFLGPNGAGKSTTMKIITGFMPPTDGNVTIAGYDIVTESLEARKHIGYLPETVPLYTDMTIKDYLEYMGRLRGMSRDYINQRISEVIDICNLGDYNSTIISKLSKGFRQRVGIAQAILHEPDVLVLDEPTIGIDPIQVVETRQLIKNLGGEHTLIVSTHILPEVSQICERVIIIHEGQIIAEDTPENLAQRLVGSERVDLDVKGPQQDVLVAFQQVEGVREAVRLEGPPGSVPRYRVQSELGIEIRADLASTVINSGWELLRLDGVIMSLEEIFLRLTTEDELIQQVDSTQEDASAE
ncbi:MAG: MFS transporter [SAR202 cluster bacterium Io17-Chloro-G1]|nr:ABC transporter ATP-binding protein [Dehalococcoidia bacterium]PKB62642.1 MAG: MFS transporter [SAR202 cluster bacterium Io17-Chloro-G1]